MRNTVAAPETRSHAVDLVRDGATFDEAGKAVGVSDYAVRKWCKAAGVRSARAIGGPGPSRAKAALVRVGSAVMEEPPVAEASAVAEAVPVAPSPPGEGGSPVPAASAPALPSGEADPALPPLLGTVEARVARRVMALAEREGRPVGQVLTRLLLEVLGRWE